MSAPEVADERDERLPLLRPEADVGTSANHPSQDEANESAAKQWTKADIACFSILGLVGFCIIAVIFKGFLDAGDVDFDLGAALKKALGGGLSGAAAMVLQVLTLMPLRTVMNYQYRYGTKFTSAIRVLYEDGGYGRFYSGLGAALIQGPVSRFGDTAANAGILALLQSNSYLKNLPILVKTVFASLASALFRMLLTPIDTIKTTLQTEGPEGRKLLRERIRANGWGSLFYGAWATAGANFLGHYPWFATYNFLSDTLPLPNTLLEKLLRQAVIGFAASVVSDSVSNFMRVLKTYRQVHATKVSYAESARRIIAADGVKGLFGRGLKTRILTNGLQGIMFSVLWKLFLDLWDEKTKA